MWHCVLSCFQNKTCVQTLEGHAQNVSCVSFHPELPIIITGSEDGNFGFSAVERTGKALRAELLWCCGCTPAALRLSWRDAWLCFSPGTVRIWHSSTYRLESTLNYGMERVWCVASLRGSNNVALGYDEGSIIVKVHLMAWSEKLWVILSCVHNNWFLILE